MRKIYLASICAALGFVFISLCGCVGTYNNTTNFLNPPDIGTEEITVLKELGSPVFSTVVEDQKVYIYRARNVKYIILVGLYEGFDLVVICRDGMVVESKKVPRPKTFTLFYPTPWAVAD